MNIITITLISISLLVTSCHTEHKQPDPNYTIYYEHDFPYFPESNEQPTPEASPQEY